MRIPFTKYEIRAAKRPRPDDWDDFWYSRSGGTSSAGIDVTEDNALRFSAVWSCVKVISEDLSSLPLIIYRRGRDGKDRAPDHPLYRLLHDAPNDEMTSMQFRETLQGHVLTWGNAFAEIQRDLRGIPRALWPLNPAAMTIMRDDDDALVYHYKLTDGRIKEFAKEDIFHLPGLSFNGLVGYSVIGYHRESIGVGLAAQEFQASSFKNGARLSMVFVHPNPKGPSPEGRKIFREQLNREYAGSANAGKIGVLWEGMKPEPISMNMADAQFIEQRKFTRGEIAAIFRVPPHKIMDLERATFSNIEQQSIDYVIGTIRPWATRWEQAINMRLLEQSGQYYAEHLVDGLMRGDLKSRYDAYAVGRQWGWLSVNDIRGLENLNPIPNGDLYLQPMNMVEAGKQPDPADAPDGQDEALPADGARKIRLIGG